MIYQPINSVWEITMDCNMRCGHCGSSCTEPLPDELNTEEAFEVCDQLADLGIRWVTLSGGEPLIRKDLPLLVERLHNHNVAVNIITNGWLMEQEMAVRLKKSGISTVAISIDGIEEIHDKIRKPHAFQHAKQAFSILTLLNIKTGAVTTITKQNIEHLEQLKETLIDMGVETWQVQLGLPMGNLKEKIDWVIEPQQVEDIINFCAKTAKEGKIRIYPADSIGYYTKKEWETKKISYQLDTVSIWDGCNAGIRGFGILHNGDILGCTSIRNPDFIEGNIRKRSLREIWEDENSFQWRRQINRDKLTNLCKACRYSDKCLGGCPNTRLTINGSIYSENQYCAYHLELKRMEKKYDCVSDPEALFRLAEELIREGEYQEASFALDRVLTLTPKDRKALKAKGYTAYMCGDYQQCKEANEKAIALNTADPYALQGYGLALCKLKKEEQGIESLRTAVQLTEGRDIDLIYDLQLMEREQYIDKISEKV